MAVAPWSKDNRIAARVRPDTRQLPRLDSVGAMCWNARRSYAAAVGRFASPRSYSERNPPRHTKRAFTTTDTNLLNEEKSVAHGSSRLREDDADKARRQQAGAIGRRFLHRGNARGWYARRIQVGNARRRRGCICSC